MRIVTGYIVDAADTESCRVQVRSSWSGEMREMMLPVSADRLRNWIETPHPGLIQEVFPEMTPEQREFLLTGMTPEEWEEAFGNEEEDEDDDAAAF